MDDSNGGIPATMLVSPSGGFGGGFGNSFGGNGDWGWIILLLLLAGGGWGNGFGGFGGGMNDIYPWMNQANLVSNGFRDQLINDNIIGIRSDLGDISTQLCNGFNSTQMGILQAVNGLQSSFSDCCCENRLATVQTQNVIASEGAATRANATANTQAILDKLCQLEMDGYKREIDNLRGQLADARMAASQTAQTSRILADNAAQTVALEQYLNPVPVPAYIVQNPNCCNQNNGCGCGCGNF